MSLTVETTTELEGKIREDAARHGLDAASYVLRLLQDRYAAAPPPAPSDAPEGAMRWHSLSGLDADAIEDRRRGGGPPPSVARARHRVSRREQRRHRLSGIWIRAVIALVAVLLLGGLMYARFHRPARHSHASPPPRPARAR